MIAVCDEDFESFLMLHIYPDRLKTALAEKSIFLKEEVIRIEVLLKEQAKRIRLGVEKFSLGFLQFQDVGMQTFAEFLEQYTGADREEIVKFIRREQEEDPSGCR